MTNSKIDATKGDEAAIRRIRRCHLHVLVVDDVAAYRQSLSRYLHGRYDAAVTEASSGYRALELVRSEDFDLILLDIAMPAMDGIHTYLNMRADGVDATIAFMSANVDQEKLSRAAALGTTILRKPLDEEALVAVLLNCNAGTHQHDKDTVD